MHSSLVEITGVRFECVLLFVVIVLAPTLMDSFFNLSIDVLSFIVILKGRAEIISIGYGKAKSIYLIHNLWFSFQNSVMKLLMRSMALNWLSYFT